MSAHFHNTWSIISLISNIKWPFCAFIFWTYSCSHDEEHKDSYNFDVHGMGISILAGFYGDAWVVRLRLRRTFCKFLIFIIVVNYTMSVLSSLLYTQHSYPCPNTPFLTCFICLSVVCLIYCSYLMDHGHYG